MDKINALCIFTTTCCNLSCKYCYLKDTNFQQLDHKLDIDFKSGKILNRLDKLDLSNLSRLIILGGEPLLHLERVFNFIHRLIELTSLQTIHITTNLSSIKFVNKIYDLICLLNQYPNRKFVLSIKVSIDGCGVITDMNRGAGTTSKILSAYDSLIHLFKSTNMHNVSISFSYSSVIGLNQLHFFTNKDFICENYNFVDEWLGKYVALSELNSNVFKLSYPSQVIADPEAITQHDGYLFSTMCKNIREVENLSLFKYLDDITPYSKRRSMLKYVEIPNQYKSYKPYMAQVQCCQGFSMIGLLPDNKFTTCFRALEQCKNRQFFIFDSYEDIERYRTVECRSSTFKSKSHISQMATNIQFLAQLGQIDKKYTNAYLAKNAASDIISSKFICQEANLEGSGSVIVPLSSTIRLFLNGAIDYII